MIEEAHNRHMETSKAYNTQAQASELFVLIVDMEALRCYNTNMH